MNSFFLDLIFFCFVLDLVLFFDICLLILLAIDAQCIYLMYVIE